MKSDCTTQDVELKSITADNKVNCRADGVSQSVVQKYAAAMKEGAAFPPIELVRDGEQLLLAHGFHRRQAAVEAGLTHIQAIVRQGTRRDALVIAAASNIEGRSRSLGDKTKAIKVLLADAEWKKKSNREIAAKLGVSHTLVNKVKGPPAAKVKPKVETVSTPPTETNVETVSTAAEPETDVAAIARELDTVLHPFRERWPAWVFLEALQGSAAFKGAYEERAAKWRAKAEANEKARKAKEQADRRKVQALMTSNPKLSNRKIAEETGASPFLVNKIRKSLVRAS